MPAMAPVTPNVAMPKTGAIIPPDNSAQAAARAALIDKLAAPAAEQSIVKADNPAQAAARAALVEKLAEPAAPEQIVKADNAAQATARAVLLEKLSQPEPETIVKADNSAQAAARAALLDKLAQTPAPVTTPSASVVASTPAPVAPALPSSKEERLAELLAKYKADQITPLEYHTQRAEIIHNL